MVRIGFVVIRAIGILLILGLIEFASQKYLNQPQPVTRAPAYQYADYWSPEFVQQSSSPGVVFSDDGYWVFNDYHGQWMNIQDGVRRTTDQLAQADHTVWMLGSSTLFGGSVPDNLTISSYLQRLMGSHYRVVNLGVDGAGSATELIRLQKTIPVQRGDVVIFYDGVMDAMGDYLAARDVIKKRYVCGQLLDKLSKLASIQLLCGWINRLDINEVRPDMTKIQHNIDLARRYSEQAGARFYHFLHPILWSMPLRGYEQTLHSKENTDQVVQDNWPTLEQLPDTIDLTHILDKTRQAGIAIYFDGWHINEKGNELVANAIYQAIKLPVF